jgi:hypothetical protein
MNRVYTSAKGVKVSYDDMIAQQSTYKKAIPKNEVVQAAQAQAEELQINGFIPAPPKTRTPKEVTTVVVDKKADKAE